MIQSILAGGSVTLAMIFVLLNPIDAAAWVIQGYQLFLHRLLPSLFLPMLLSGFLYHSPLRKPLGKLCSPVLSPLFGTNGEESLALLLSFLCGYPTGILLLTSLGQKQRLSPERYNRLCLFCNNCGVGFLFSYLAPLFSLPVACCLFFSQLCASLLLSRLALIGKVPPFQVTEKEESSGYLVAFFAAMKQTLSSLCSMGGFIIFFTFCIRLCTSLPFIEKSLFASTLSVLALDLSSACLFVAQNGLSPIFCALAIGWGGLCVWAQSSMASDYAKLGGRYFLFKGINALFCAVFYLLFSFIVL